VAAAAAWRQPEWRRATTDGRNVGVHSRPALRRPRLKTRGRHRGILKCLLRRRKKGLLRSISLTSFFVAPPPALSLCKARVSFLVVVLAPHARGQRGQEHVGPLKLALRGALLFLILVLSEGGASLLGEYQCSVPLFPLQVRPERARRRAAAGPFTRLSTYYSLTRSPSALCRRSNRYKKDLARPSVLPACLRVGAGLRAGLARRVGRG